MKRIKAIWYKIGMKLFGNFFTQLFYVKSQRLKQSRVAKAERHRMHKQGLKVYDVGGIKVVAQNQKNADRKAANIRVKQSSLK